MKTSILKAEVYVPSNIKVFALILAMLDPMYYVGREELIRRLAQYYKVTL